MEANPFQSPETIEPNPSSRGGKEPIIVPYASAAPRAQLAIVLLALKAALSVLSIVAMLSQAALLSRAADGLGIAPEDAAINDTRVNAIGVGELALVVGSAIAFIAWLHRSYRNLPALGVTHLEYSPGWAIGGWFIPFLNFVRPYQVVKEVWLASSPESVGNKRWRSAPVSPLLKLWWGSFLIGRIAGRIADGMLTATGSGTHYLLTLQNGSLAMAAADVVEILAAVAAILVVRDITARQERAHEIVLSAEYDGAGAAAH